ncbi:hypothetical protein FPV67DRAFT_1445399 [Lyophyllum atratum]|nr:hypothetical protein FPV67DRAFT_1445399 [Lyophyllum atratum]
MTSLATGIAIQKLTPAESLHKRLTEARQNLLASGFYLGDPAFTRAVQSKLVWAHIGREKSLVTKESMDAVEAAQKAAQAAEVDGTTPPPIPPLKMADLSIVVEITKEDFWMVACGMWKGPTQACRTLGDMKLSCTGAKPGHEVFAADYASAVSSIRGLMELCVTPGFKNKKGVLVPQGINQKVKFRHVLFEPVTGDDDDSDTASDTNNIPKEHKIENWPAVYDAAKEALASMVDTHNVIPLPAYDMHGALLWPIHYRAYLEGALVQVHFNLTHWSIGAKDSNPAVDTYVADISNIRVLTPPVAKGPVTPRKRKVSAKDPMTPDSQGSSPSKKNRT